MSDKFFIIDAEGNETLVGYEDLDEDMLETALQPIGGFIFEGEAFLRLALPNTPFYIKDWLPKHGKMMIYGSAKAGKTNLGVQLSRCIAQGEPFLDIATNSGRVLYLQHELGIETFQNRLKKTGQSYEGVYFGTTFSMMLDKKEGQDMLIRALEAVHPQVLVLDPIYKLISGDENEAQDVMIILRFLDSVIEMFETDGLSVLTFHHAGKDPDRGGRGSSVMEGWVDSYIELKRTSPYNMPLKATITSRLLRHAAAPKDPLNIVLAENLEFQVGDAPLKIADKLLRYAEGRETFKMQGAIDAGVGSRKSLYDARGDLLKAGKIIELEGNSYRKT